MCCLNESFEVKYNHIATTYPQDSRLDSVEWMTGMVEWNSRMEWNDELDILSPSCDAHLQTKTTFNKDHTTLLSKLHGWP